MAGSYSHVNPDKEGHWSLIENMGDAYECVEELLFIIRSCLEEYEVDHTLEVLSWFKQGKVDPRELGAYGRAYLEVQEVMDGDRNYREEAR